MVPESKEEEARRITREEEDVQDRIEVMAVGTFQTLDLPIRRIRSGSVVIDHSRPLTPGEEAYLGRALVVVEGPATVTDGNKTEVVPDFWIIRRKDRRRQMVPRHSLTAIADQEKAEREAQEKAKALVEQQREAKALCANLNDRLKELGLYDRFRIEVNYTGRTIRFSIYGMGIGDENTNTVDLVERLEALVKK